MSDLERTPAGLQMVIPWMRTGTLPRSTTRVHDIGQGLLSFYRPPTLKERLADRANAPLRPSKARKALPRLVRPLIGRIAEGRGIHAG